MAELKYLFSCKENSARRTPGLAYALLVRRFALFLAPPPNAVPLS